MIRWRESVFKKDIKAGSGPLLLEFDLRNGYKCRLHFYC